MRSLLEKNAFNSARQNKIFEAFGSYHHRIPNRETSVLNQMKVPTLLAHIVVTIGFVDDIKFIIYIIVLHFLGEIKTYACKAIYDIKSRLKNVSLSLAKHKTIAAFIID